MALYSWGERGLVASYFHDVDACENLVGWSAFLNAIHFPLNGRVLKNAWGVVEPDFWNRAFGQPDFIAVLEFDTEPTKCCLLLEAKVCSYLEASEPDRNRKGFNSSINGQIELNHRLALALELYQPGNVRLVEPDWIMQRADYATPNPDTPRYLKNRLVLEQLANTMCGLRSDQYHHVIITADEDDPRPHISPAHRPRIWQSETVDGWNSFLNGQFHWSNWTALFEHSADWPKRKFRANYDFMRCGERRILRRGPLPADRPYSGVSLVLLRNLYPRNPPTFLHFSWRGTGYRLRDFSGAARLDVHFPQPKSLQEVVDDIALERDVPRQDFENYEWWHERTVEANQIANPPRP